MDLFAVDATAIFDEIEYISINQYISNTLYLIYIKNRKK